MCILPPTAAGFIIRGANCRILSVFMCVRRVFQKMRKARLWARLRRAAEDNWRETFMS